MPYKGLKNACSESKQLDRLSGFETQISYDPTTTTVYADTNPIGNTVVYHAPIVELGKIKHPMTMQELSAWLDEKIDERNAENRWHKDEETQQWTKQKEFIIDQTVDFLMDLIGEAQLEKAAEIEQNLDLYANDYIMSTFSGLTPEQSTEAINEAVQAYQSY